MNTVNEKITELFKANADELLRMCFLYLKDMGLAEDAVSETFLKAYRGLAKFKGNSSEKTWLTRIAINVCNNIMRSRSYKEGVSDDGFWGALRDDSNHYGEVENRLCVSAAITGLPVKEREVILLYYYRELTTREIAELLRIPRTTVDYRLRNAKSILKTTLGDF